MEPGRFFILDVFAQARYQGNQLAVIRAWEGLETAEMQALAREFNFSETTFILADKPGPNGFPVRIFTPGGEVPFAGHPTLGTAQVLFDHFLPDEAEELTLDLAVGPIGVVRRAGDTGLAELWMTQAQPRFGRQVDSGQAAAAVGLDLTELQPDLPVIEVSTGLPFLIIPVGSLEAIQRAEARLRFLPDLIADLEAKMPYLFCLQTVRPENNIHVRMFGHAYGVPEDPATGSAAGCLAAYLVEYGLLGSGPIRARVEQGHEIDRPSLLLIEAERDGEQMIIKVGGSVVTTAQGRLLV